jgi:exosortase A-associated hydrolase 2
MHKSRRMAALQARSLADMGYAVLQIDLLGCGDSSGEIRDASVSAWHADIEVAATWMLRQGFTPLRLWGLRFGALLAADWARKNQGDLDGLALWQPISSGEAHLTQFLRVSMAADMLASGNPGAGSSALRKRLAAGEVLEVAGYDVNPTLAREMDALRLSDAVSAVNMPVDWFEVVEELARGLPPASARMFEQWRSRGTVVHEHLVTGAPFWATVEIVDCPGLLEATNQVARERWQRHSKSTA